MNSGPQEHRDLSPQQIAQGRYYENAVAPSEAKLHRETRIASCIALGCAVVLVGYLVSNGSDTSGASPELGNQPAGTPAGTASTEIPGTEVPLGVACAPSKLQGSQRDTAIARCSDMLDGATIAMVDFGAKDAVNKQTADRITQQLSAITGGRVQAKIKPIQASAAAQAQFNMHLAGKDCIDDRLPSQYASTAADETMDLTQYDLVIGASDKKACSSGDLTQVGGAADTAGGRIIDLFSISMFGGVATQPYFEADAEHELLHQFDLGHAGELSLPAHGGRSVTLQDFLSQKRTAPTFDIDYYAGNARLWEYASSNRQIMGGNTSDSELINGPQLHCLDQAAEAVGRKAPQLKHEIDDNPVTFTRKQALDGSYVSLSLDKPLLFTAEDTGSRAYFDEVAIAPKQDLDNPSRIGGYEAMLVDNETCQVASMGTVLATDGEAASWKMKTGAHERTISIGRDGLTVS